MMQRTLNWLAAREWPGLGDPPAGGVVAHDRAAREVERRLHLEAEALERAASVNELYVRALERTAELTNSELGATRAPHTYAAHIAAAAARRRQAREIRAKILG